MKNSVFWEMVLVAFVKTNVSGKLIASNIHMKIVNSSLIPSILMMEAIYSSQT
jgi:ABC-type uncharacterized transport system permease subunit